MDYWTHYTVWRGHRRQLLREAQQLLLGLLLAEPWAGERGLAVALYAEAGAGANDIVARIDRHRATYPHEAGYHRWEGSLRMDLSRPVERREGHPADGWRRRIALVGASVAALLLPEKEWEKART